MIRLSVRRSIPFIALIAFTLSQSACLKTRAQLRDEGDDPAAPIALKQGPQEVRPQGGYVIDEIKGEVTRLQGRLEDLERAQKQQTPNAATADDMKKLETRIVELEQAQANMLDAIKKMQETPPAADPGDLLKKGKNQVEAGNVEGAVETFGACIKSAKSKVKEDCTFLRAEAHYALKDYKKAIVDYSQFPEKHSKSAYMPRALFQIGRAFEALGMKDDAKGFYQELVEKFPKSPEAKKSRSKAQ
jgi:TolA-binding protein